MNGIIAKIFGFFVGLLSLAVIGGVYAINFHASIDNSFGIDIGLISVIVIIIYIFFVGTLSVLIHTRELAEQQLEKLEQIEYQIRQQNFQSHDSLITQKITELGSQQLETLKKIESHVGRRNVKDSKIDPTDENPSIIT